MPEPFQLRRLIRRHPLRGTRAENGRHALTISLVGIVLLGVAPGRFVDPAQVAVTPLQR